MRNLFFNENTHEPFSGTFGNSGREHFHATGRNVVMFLESNGPQLRQLNAILSDTDGFVYTKGTTPLALLFELWKTKILVLLACFSLSDTAKKVVIGLIEVTQGSFDNK